MDDKLKAISSDYDIKKIYEQIELDLISSMQRTLGLHQKDEDLKGFKWPQWQALKLKQIKDFRKNNVDIFGEYDNNIKGYIHKAIKSQFKEGARKVNKEAIKAGFLDNNSAGLGGSFFGINDRKVKAMINSMDTDLENIRTATLRMSNDVYRSTIYKASQMANSGAKTLNEAIDMATKDFLARGFNCIEYKDGRRINIADYADMAVRTATKRANLMGEGELRKQIGNPLVYVSKHGTSCDKCGKWQGRVYIDDVWSGGKAEDGKYPLLSTAIAGGLYHNRCRHGQSTYFEGINDEPEEVQENEHNHNDEYIQELQRRKKQYERLATGSLFSNNVKNYSNKASDLQNQINSATIVEKNEIDGETKLEYIGKIDKDKIGRYADKIATDEVVLTGERKAHIFDDHPLDYEKILRNLKRVVIKPDEILEDAKNKDTLFYIGKLDKNNLNVIVRLNTTNSQEHPKNSVMTAWIIRDSNLKKLRKKNKTIYKIE